MPHQRYAIDKRGASFRALTANYSVGCGLFQYRIDDNRGKNRSFVDQGVKYLLCLEFSDMATVKLFGIDLEL